MICSRTAAAHFTGHTTPPQIKAMLSAIADEEKQRAKDAEEATKKALAEGASQDQMNVIVRRETTVMRQVRAKAMAVMGEELVEHERGFLSEGSQATSKTLKLLGEVQSTGNRKLEKVRDGGCGAGGRRGGGIQPPSHPHLSSLARR